MKILRSLKYRIAITIFFLEIILLSLFLWQTQKTSYTTAQQEIHRQDRVISELLAEISYSALFSNDFNSLEPYLVKAEESPHIKAIRLYDDRELLVASSNPDEIGSKGIQKNTQENSYLHTQTIYSGDNTIGTLSILFSSKELTDAYKNSINVGIYLGIPGMLLIAIIGVLMGHFLTRRLNHVAENTRLLAEGEWSSRCDIKGDDEIAHLGQSFNLMANQIEKNIQDISYQANHDQLTALPNRRAFQKQIEEAVDDALVNKSSHALMFLDLDQFKIVNDSHGHHAGDQLLINLVSCLRQILPEDNIKLSRIGGDEFAVLIHHTTLQHAQNIAERIRKTVFEFIFHWGGENCKIGVSIGLALIDQYTKNTSSLLSMVDNACYAAKENGRNNIQIANNENQQLKKHSFDFLWVNKINNGLEDQQFEIIYQHIYPLNTYKKNSWKKVFNAEFLLRYKDDETGKLISPDMFLPTAERYDLMQKIDKYVINHVLHLLSQLNDDLLPAISFINLSGSTVGHKGFASYIAKKIEFYKIKPERVCFEITETSAINNFNDARQFIDKIRKLGCKFALDDFGSGMCSFTYLRQLPIDYIKIDGSFIVKMLENPVDKSIVKSINDVAHQASFKTIAEYVESQEILDELISLNVDFVQGFALHKPNLITT